MKYKNLFLVLVLIFVVSISAVSAVEVDIGTGVLETTDDLSVDSVSMDEDLDDGGLVDESLDSSSDADSVDDDLSESEIIDETEEYMDGNLFDTNEIDYELVDSSLVEDYFYDDGTLKTDSNLEFDGNFDVTDLNFNMFVIDRPIKLKFNDNQFYNVGFNLKSPNLNISDVYFEYDDTYMNTSIISINSENCSVSDVSFFGLAPYNSDFILIDANNANNTVLINNNIEYYMYQQFFMTYNLSCYNYVFKLDNCNNSLIKGNNITALLPLKSVNFAYFQSIYTDLVACVAIQDSDYLQFLNNNLQVYVNSLASVSYPTLDAFIIAKSDNGIISNNSIFHTDMNSTGSNYLYGVDVYSLSNLTICNNTIDVNSNGGSISPFGAGAAYPIQITGPIGSIYIHDNKLTTHNHGPNLGIFSQNYYGPTNLTIYNNVINVTGLASGGEYNLVSGMELEDTYAEVYNNTINVINELAYSQGNAIFGISYYQNCYHPPYVFKIYNNTVVTNGHYAIYLMSSSGTQVYNNSLKTHDLCCNNAVYIYSGTVSGNYCPCINCICNSTNHCSCGNDVSIDSMNDMGKKHVLTSPLIDIISDGGSNEYEIYVGPNNAETGGSGTLEDPYNNLSLALDSVNGIASEDNIINVTIIFYGGTHTLSRSITLNNYINFVFKTLNNEMAVIDGTLNLAKSSSNPTYCSREFNYIYFNPNGLANVFRNGCHGLLEFNNCIFNPKKAGNMYLTPDSYEVTRIFNNCTFGENLTSISSKFTFKDAFSNISFKNCIFNQDLSFTHTNVTLDTCEFSSDIIYLDDVNINIISSSLSNLERLSSVGDLASSSLINYNWWGLNDISSIQFISHYSDVSQYDDVDAIPSIYAVFNTSSNYLGNNQWEIIGKLTWNDGSIDGIENFAPMSVMLSSESGTLNDSYPILENGIFKVIYYGEALTNEITATLDREVQTLSFNVVDLSVLVDDISYGEYANVSVNAPDNINGSFTVTVNNVPYTIQTTEKSFVVPITELLSVGTYTVDVVLADAENNIYGSNSTTFEVKKADPKDVDSILDVTVPSDATSASFSIDLPGATGNLTVTVNNKNYTKELVDGKATVDITDLPAGTYNAVITYSGDDNFASISKNTTVTIKSTVPAKVATKLSAPKVTATYNVAKKLVITLKDANGKVLANKKVSVKVGSISKTLKTNSKGQVSLNVAKLVPKTYTATVKFAGDSGYIASTLKPKVVVKKAKVKLAAKAKTFKAKVKVKKYIVTLKNNKGKVMKKVKLTLKIGKKTYKAKTNSKGKATFKITKLTKKGKKTATVKFAGNKYYKAISKKVKITIKK